MKTILSLTLASFLAFLGPVLVAQAADATSAPPTGGSAVQATSDMTDGEVRKVDLDNKKITLRHAEIKSLGMPGMTMVFQVKDPAMLDKVKTGDKVRFTAEKMNGALTVTNIEAGKVPILSHPPTLRNLMNSIQPSRLGGRVPVYCSFRCRPRRCSVVGTGATRVLRGQRFHEANGRRRLDVVKAPKSCTNR